MRTLADKALRSLREEGIRGFLFRTRQYLKKRSGHVEHIDQYVDVLFVNGCPLPHPYRYRVQHQREQLCMQGLSSEEVYYEDVRPEMVNLCRTVVIYRCPITPDIEEFIRRAKFFNKQVLFDIDDLVIDTKYTDQIPFVAAMSPEDKSLYDDGVNRYRRTMQLCDAVITTTEALAEELESYMPEVIVNRNAASGTMVALSELARKDRAGRKSEEDTVTLGYFSGSITHNDDVELILPVLVKLLRFYPRLRLLLVGELDLPAELEAYRKQVVFRKFVDWTKLPALIAEADINLVPLRDTIFNAAKSENKWVEASLVGVPTVASRVGAFERMMEDGQTGLLCSDGAEWEAALRRLIESPEERSRLAETALDYVLKHCTTETSGRELREFILSRRKPSIAFLTPSLLISGGILVALKHADILREAGYDVTVVNMDNRPGSPALVPWASDRYASFLADKTVFQAAFDQGVATMWLTTAFFRRGVVRRPCYLVQNLETGFYDYGTMERMSASATYCQPGLEYLTISRWCQDWLQERFGQASKYAPNGLDRQAFAPVERDWNGTIRILIEGDSSSEYKNVDESFRIVAKLPKDKFEIWYVSYQGKGKSWYRVDKFFYRVPNEKMPDIYRQCHILVKSSILESFSYPPLEMMATGGMVVVRPNGGNSEYLEDGENCLLYAPDDLDTAVEAIDRLLAYEGLRQKLQEGGCRTAEERDWKKCEESILGLYR